ncbi:hypothetical protein KFL_000160210 [Klebsormidium nitens]|uniref:EGF-like domain-containing protein n=1 Tax=Klebsormidium nitens TaxID=105231 RepID=A0A1Y1HS07_KLENI|nr:hypothetical protein KFL_000160210 [Klebsormidium nitens]|eukprot:GAQ78618.1 hypothetical protein KFL_000160210 [Klebsormidium nitens]
MSTAVSTLVALLVLLSTTVFPTEGRQTALHHNRRLHQTAPAPAPVGQVCSNGLVCPENQRCDTTQISDTTKIGTQTIIQCLCVTGYNGPECPAPYSVTPTPTTDAVTPSPPALSAPPALVAAAPASGGQVCSNGLVCPEKQRCDTTSLFSNRGQQKVVQCVCVTGYNGPECPAPYSVPPAATAAPSPPAGTVSSAAAVAASVAPPGSTSLASSEGSGGIGVAAIVGIAVGCAAAVGLLAVGVLFGLRRRREQQKAVEFQDFHKAHHSMDTHQQPAPPPDPEA